MAKRTTHPWCSHSWHGNHSDCNYHHSATGSIYHDSYSCQFNDTKQQGGVVDIEPFQLASAALESAYQRHQDHHQQSGQDPSLDDAASTSLLDKVDEFYIPVRFILIRT
jgi:hypothetical protein